MWIHTELQKITTRPCSKIRPPNLLNRHLNVVQWRVVVICPNSPENSDLKKKTHFSNFRLIIVEIILLLKTKLKCRKYGFWFDTWEEKNKGILIILFSLKEKGENSKKNL